jgi:hypothetical protein
MCTLQKFKIVFFVPPSALQACKTAIFAAGAGRFPGTGGYTECCFTSKGTGQFRPGDAANPHVSRRRLVALMSRTLSNADVKQIGKVGALEEVEEYRVEAICLGRDTAVEAVKALRK